MAGALDGNAWRLAFKGSGDGGVMRLLLPTEFMNYSADIHDGKVAGAGGPLLYKEWRFEGRVQGAGPFKPGKLMPTHYFPVLQGRGNGCDNAEDFTHWHLRLAAGGAKYSFTGQLHL